MAPALRAGRAARDRAAHRPGGGPHVPTEAARGPPARRLDPPRANPGGPGAHRRGRGRGPPPPPAPPPAPPPPPPPHPRGGAKGGAGGGKKKGWPGPGRGGG